MRPEKLQKSALVTNLDDMPIEVLDPVHSSQYYSVRMYPPAAVLADVIDHYWVMHWTLPDKKSFTAEVIPSPYINLTFMAGGAKITGVTTGKYTYEVAGTGTIVGAKFKPGGYHSLTGNRAYEVTDKVLPAQDVFDQANDAINDKALAAKDDSEAVSLMESVLLAYETKPDSNLSLINKIIDEIKLSRYDKVSSIAAEYGLSDRRLQELFQTYVGVGLKWVILRYRLLMATQIALSTAETDWTKVAVDLGYSDQSHFINDFKRIIGKTPKQYAKLK